MSEQNAMLDENAHWDAPKRGRAVPTIENRLYTIENGLRLLDEIVCNDNDDNLVGRLDFIHNSMRDAYDALRLALEQHAMSIMIKVEAPTVYRKEAANV